MRLPKTRDTIYLVVRLTEPERWSVPIASFRTPERADEYAGACQQDFLDRGVPDHLFETQAVIYYDE